MTSAGSLRPAAPPDPAVLAALADPDVLDGLRRHAVARLGVLLRDRPAAVRADAAAEAVQKTGHRALGRAGTFDPRQATAAAWLHGVLNLVLHEHCRELRKQPAQASVDPAAWDGLEARVSAPDRLPALRALVARLPRKQREIVTLHHLDGLPHEQIAAALGTTVGNSRVKLARAMTELKRLAKEDV